MSYIGDMHLQLEITVFQTSHSNRIIKITGRFSVNSDDRQVAEISRELTSGWPLQRAKLWKEMLTTDTGKAMGEQRFAFYQQFRPRDLEFSPILVEPTCRLAANHFVGRPAKGSLSSLVPENDAAVEIADLYCFVRHVQKRRLFADLSIGLSPLQLSSRA